MSAPRTFAAVLAGAIAAATGNPERLAATGMNRASGPDGGFLVPPEVAEPLLAGMVGASILAPLCDRRVSGRPSAGLRVPAIDETSRADGARWGGVRGYWLAEANAIPATKPRFRTVTLRPRKFGVLVYSTDELAEDVPALEQHLRTAFEAEAGFALDDAIAFGSGVDRPLGFAASEACLTVPKETGQAAATVMPENLARMWARLPTASRRRAVWLVNEDVEALVSTMAGADRVYRPAGGDRPDATLYGRPLIAIEQAPALGQFGDISLVDLSQYLLLDLGVRQELSIHVRFFEDELVARFILRVDGAPAWRSPVAARNGSGLRSPFVALEARA